MTDQTKPLPLPLTAQEIARLRSYGVGGMLRAADLARLCDAAEASLAQQAEIERLRADAARRDRGMISMADVISNHCIAMQAVVIDGHLRSPQDGLQWIVNTLYGPGLVPDLDEARALGGAQAWFDAETAKAEAEADRARRLAAPTDAGQAGE